VSGREIENGGVNAPVSRILTPPIQIDSSHPTSTPQVARTSPWTCGEQAWSGPIRLPSGPHRWRLSQAGGGRDWILFATRGCTAGCRRSRRNMRSKVDAPESRL